MNLSIDQLLLDLYYAEHIARRHKSRKRYVQLFESNLDENLRSLANDLFNHTYIQQPFKRFIYKGKIKREIFSAKFRDRIVHHLYFNYVHEMFEKTFIEDCYSCIKGKGTSYGIDRLDHHIRSESLNYTRDCYALQIDLTAYFMNINRELLLEIVNKQLQKFQLKYSELYDFDFLFYLTKTIIDIDPIKHCNYLPLSAYEDIPLHKTLVGAKPGCGLPIGNLTSQLYSNVYMNVFDQFVKRVLKCKHYGRYVDDSFIISHNFDFLVSIIPEIEKFLNEELGLAMNRKKTKIVNVKYGVKFLGTYIKPFRRYICHDSLNHMAERHFADLQEKTPYEIYLSNKSNLGYLKSFNQVELRKNIFK